MNDNPMGSSRQAGCTGGPGPDQVSYEIGACFMPVQTRLPCLSGAEMQVLAWLRANALSIAKAEKRFRVDRRAIAGAIAWEMLQNVKSGPGIDVGPGKVHTFQGDKKSIIKTFLMLAWHAYISGDMGVGTWAKDVEGKKYLGPQSDTSRRRILSSPEGAITYIGAIMADIADTCDKYGRQNIHGDPVILTNVYQSRSPEEWENMLKRLPKSHRFAGGNPMDTWVASHMSFIEDGVGRSQLGR